MILNSINFKILEATKKLLKSIHHLKSSTLDKETQLQKISFLTQSFEELLEIIDINNRNISNPIKFIKTSNTDTNTNALNPDLTEYKYSDENIKYYFLYHIKYGILKVDTGNLFLNPMCMDYIVKIEYNKQIEELEKYLKLYMDINTRKCDKCKVYFKFSTGEVPTERKEELNYVAAYHKSCN